MSALHESATSRLHSEFGFYQTGTDFDTEPAAGRPKIRFVSPPYFTTACERAYGLPKALHRTFQHRRYTNAVYGGKNITTSNTFFTHGDADGWSAAGVTVRLHKASARSRVTRCGSLRRARTALILYFPSDSDSAVAEGGARGADEPGQEVAVVKRLSGVSESGCDG